MSGHSLARLLAGLVPEAPDVAITGLTLDSRAVRPGDAFVALPGAARHGIEFARGAVERGARAVLFEPANAPRLDVPACDVPFVAIDGLRRVLGEIANRFHARPSAGMTVIGVTGTNGKTSSVQLIAQALASAGHTVGTIGTLGAGLHGAIEPGERTTPDVITTHGLLARLRAGGATHVAMEVSSHALEQGRVDGVEYDVAVFTNLTRDHLDYHGTMEAYGAAKAQLFRWAGLTSAVVNADDAFGRKLLAGLPAGVHRCAYSAAGAPDAEIRAANVATSAAGIRFTLVTPLGRADVVSPLLGTFNVANLLGVAGCLHELGWDTARIAATLATLEPIDGRMNRVGGSAELPLVVVDYAHTPDALEQALQHVRGHTGGTLICVFGCGGDRDRGKRPQMAEIAERLADVVVVTDDNPRSEDGDAIVAEIAAGFRAPDRVHFQRDRARAIELAIGLAKVGDTVLIAGKGHERYQETGGVKRPFDDMAEARRSLGSRRNGAAA